MPDKILLTESNICPRCFKPTVRKDQNRCINCQARLMWPNDNFALLEREVWRSYYVFFNDRGWVHSDHLSQAAIDHPMPNAPVGGMERPSDSYGRQPMPDRCVTSPIL